MQTTLKYNLIISMEKQVHRAYLSQAMYQMLTYIKETFVIKHNYEDIQYTEHQV